MCFFLFFTLLLIGWGVGVCPWCKLREGRDGERWEKSVCVCVCLSRVTCEGDECHRRPCSPRARLSACCFWWQPDWLMIRIYHLDLWRACPTLLAARMQVCCVFELATSSDRCSLESHKNLHVCVKWREVDTRLCKKCCANGNLKRVASVWVETFCTFGCSYSS